MDALLEGLNDAQKSAVTSPAGVVQVLAPPGSGKTKTLTARVAYHISHERLQPWNIVVCTFTTKAAREMKERIKEFVGEKLEQKLIMGTFHSVARHFLSRYGQEIGIDKNFGIADTSDSSAILKRIVTRYQYTVEPGHARSRISKLKAKGISADDFRTTAKNVNENEFASVYSSYQEHLKASNLLDFDDLLVRCVDLLRQVPSCVSTIQAVLIDEYQDTNNIQYELMRFLAQRTGRITIVGDPDQSIYGFRSAEIKNLHRMRTDYPESVVINLENNYRSSGYILSSAMAVIEQDESRPQRSLIATHGVGEQPTLRHLVSANIEAMWIVEEIHRTRTLLAGLLSYNDYAILLRSSSLSLQIERALGQAGIPYRMVAGTKFFDRAEIRIILDYLRVISQPEHNCAVARVINVPARKVGDVTVKALLDEAEIKKITLWKLVLDVAQGRRKSESKVSFQAQKGIEQFVNVILTSREKLLPDKGRDCNLPELIGHVLKKISFESHLKQAHKENWQERWANVEELVNQATHMATVVANGEEIADDAVPIVDAIAQQQDTAADILSKFLANVTLSSAADQEGGELDQVTMSTIHAAKGLEWPVVFMPAVYDGSIPHSRADDEGEERHLARILRRPCPSSTDIDAAPTREEMEDGNFSWGTSSDDKFKGSHPRSEGPQQVVKRRKLESSNSCSSGVVPVTNEVTMKAGFTSARELGDVQAMQREAERIRTLASVPDAEPGKAAHAESRKGKGKPAGANTIKVRAIGQEPITSFFKRTGSTVGEEVEPGSQSSLVYHMPLPLYDMSNARPAASRTPRLFQALPVPTHKLQNRPIPYKPQRRASETETADTQYVLLSSSPTKPDAEEASSLSRMNTELKDQRSPVKNSSTSRDSATNFRAASTLHTTSMNRMQRKTLGTRRSMQGWSVKHNQMPKPRPP
ncbi:UvrD-helicase-domain-containing protein [Decorospora gaudefroyi]|uniref:DNA 3'-5' helicase n=1 Tax=Decorospora gaudefroyi TaxID=184978 RepID=A0A6A5KFA8_9PLEO|nr:UvrD-helicase-domain-containing protein [Decorospora gaudefroyi]